MSFGFRSLSFGVDVVVPGAVSDISGRPGARRRPVSGGGWFGSDLSCGRRLFARTSEGCLLLGLFVWEPMIVATCEEFEGSDTSGRPWSSAPTTLVWSVWTYGRRLVAGMGTSEVGDRFVKLPVHCRAMSL